MHEVSKEELINSLLGGQPRELPRLDIPADWDPDYIRAASTRDDELSTSILKVIKGLVIPFLFVLGLIAQFWGSPMLEQFSMGLFSGILVLSGLGAVADRFFMTRNEGTGNFKRIADSVYRDGSSYWEYKDFGDSVGVASKPIFFVGLLATASIILGWYLSLFILTLTTVANVYVLIMVDTKAKALITYKKKWDLQKQAEDEFAIRQAEEVAKKNAEIDDIMRSAGELPEANALDKDGPLHFVGFPIDEVQD